MKRLIQVMIWMISALQATAQQKIVAGVTMEQHSDKKGEIVYRKEHLLELDDFRGEEEPHVDAVAMAYTGVSLRYSGSIKQNVVTLDIRLYASFDQRRSWCLPGSRNERTLAHEQRHFDITALNACALYRELQEYHFTGNFERELAELQEKYQRKNERDQDEYDGETRHGINREVQQQWNEKIRKALSESDDCYP